ncbi:lipocalin family protein [Zobellia russellii]|uniref:lipocalin family protein n=1 Tax=Zobellia russellii TaxID=248907 RepID=UPI0037DDE038
MKRSFILLSAITLGLFSSCSDDDSSESPEDALIGSWQLVSESENDDPFELDNCDLEETVIFKSDGIFEYIDYDPAEDNENECVVDDNDNFSGKWEIIEAGKLFTAEDGFDGETADYTISGDQLTISTVDQDENGTYVYKATYKKK